MRVISSAHGSGTLAKHRRIRLDEGVQVGSRFVASEEASSHLNFKNALLSAGEGDTMLSLKKLTPVRLLRNAFSQRVTDAENAGSSRKELLQILGKGRAMNGMFHGMLEDGELEIGQVSALIDKVLPAQQIVHEIRDQFSEALKQPLK